MGGGAVIDLAEVDGPLGLGSVERVTDHFSFIRHNSKSYL